MNENYIFENFIDDVVDELLEVKLEELRNDFHNILYQKVDIESIRKEMLANNKDHVFDNLLETTSKIIYDEMNDIYYLAWNFDQVEVKKKDDNAADLYRIIDQSYQKLMSTKEIKELREEYERQIAELKKDDLRALLTKEFDMLANAYYSLLPKSLNDSQKKFADTVLGLIYSIKEKNNHFIVTDANNKERIITSNNEYSYCYNALKAAYQLYQANDILKMNDLSICIQQDPANFKKQVNADIISTGNKPIKTNLDNATRLDSSDTALTDDQLEQIKNKSYTKKESYWARKKREHNEAERLAGRKISRIPGVDKVQCFFSGLALLRKAKNGIRLVRGIFSEKIESSDITGKKEDKNIFITKKEYDRIIAQQGFKDLKATEKAAKELHNSNYDVKITEDKSNVELKDPILLLENKYELEKPKENVKITDQQNFKDLKATEKAAKELHNSNYDVKTTENSSNENKNDLKKQSDNIILDEKKPQSKSNLDELTNKTREELIDLIRSGEANKYAANNTSSQEQLKEINENLDNGYDRFATYNEFYDRQKMWDEFAPILDNPHYIETASERAKTYTDEWQELVNEEQLEWDKKNKQIIQEARLQSLKTKLNVANINGDLDLDKLSELNSITDGLVNKNSGKSR